MHSDKSKHTVVNSGFNFESVTLDNKYVMIVLIAAILVIAIWLRSGLLQYQGLFEPDGFFYYTAIKQAIADGFVVTHSVTLSGYPLHNHLGESAGLLYFVLIPYVFLQYFGVSAYDIMRTIAILFGIVDAVLAYYFVKYMANSKMLGLLAMFFVATSSGNIARTAGGIFRGDSFISAFVLIALIAMLKVLNENSWDRKYLYATVAALAVGVGCSIWNGGYFVVAVYLCSMMIMAMYGFVAADRRELESMLLLMASLLVGWLIYWLFIWVGVANTSPVSDPTNFFVMFVPILLFAAVSRAIIGASSDSAKAITGNVWRRLGFMVIAVALGILVVSLLYGQTIYGILVEGGVVGTGNIGATTQELQKPTLGFLESSFGLQLIMAPLGLIIFILLGHVTGGTRHLRVKALKLNFNYGFIVAFAYLLLTGYLQYSAIRYNALISMPIALFAAYAVYAVGKLLKDYAVVLGGTQIRLVYVYTGFVLALLAFQTVTAAGQSFSSGQADGINPQFLGAMTWLSNNTASNATVLALWPDGSVVEGWGNRTSLMDSVGGENGARITAYANFLGNTSPDSQYLYYHAHKPQYIVVRTFWMAELGGLLAESNTIQNLSNYGYEPLQNISIGGNSTYEMYSFSSPYYRAQLLIGTASNGSRRVAALLGQPGSTVAVPMEHVIFENASDGNYSVVNTQNSSANYTLMISYVGRNITGAMILSPALPYSNLFKLLYECNYAQCAYDNANVTARAVFMNADTKILQMTYH